MGPHAFVPFVCEICGAQLGEQAVPICPRCRRVVCGRHLRPVSREDNTEQCEVCRGGPTSR